MVCCSGGGFGSTYCVSRHEKPRFTEKWARSYRESDPASICGLLGQRPATKAKCHLRINHTTVHLPGGTVQQGYKCDGSLRARAGTRNLGSLKSGPGPIVNQTLPKSNPVKEVGKNQRLRTVGFRIARAVGVLTPQSFPRTRMRLTEMVCCSGGGSGSTYCVGRHEKPWLIAKWAGSYRESDLAKTVVF